MTWRYKLKGGHRVRFCACGDVVFGVNFACAVNSLNDECFRRGRVSNEKRVVASSCLSVRPSVRPSGRLSAYISAAATERIFVKFDTGDFYENLFRLSKFG